MGTYGALTSEYVDPAAQAVGQGVVQVALVDPVRRQVAAGAGDGRGVEVGGVHLQVGPGGEQRGPEGAAPAAQVDRHGVRPGGLPRQPDHELAAAARHEDAGRDPTRIPANSAQPRICSSGRPLSRSRTIRSSASGVAVGCLDQQRRLLLGEHATGRAQPGHDLLLAHPGIVQARQ